MTTFKRKEEPIMKSTSAEPVNVTIKSHTDILNDLNDEITEKLKKFDIFDIEVPIIRIKTFLKIVEARNLEWMPTDIVCADIVCGHKETIVVGKKGVDFGQHEKRR